MLFGVTCRHHAFMIRLFIYSLCFARVARTRHASCAPNSWHELVAPCELLTPDEERNASADQCVGGHLGHPYARCMKKKTKIVYLCIYTFIYIYMYTYVYIYTYIYANVIEDAMRRDTTARHFGTCRFEDFVLLAVDGFLRIAKLIL